MIQEKKEISYKNDVFIKYVVGGEDEISKYIRKALLEGVLGFTIMETTVLPTEIVPDNIIGKRVILDILVKDETGKFYNIEMQLSDLSVTEALRFQKYGFQIASKQLRKGDKYAQLKVFYQIIFINHTPSDTNLFIRHFKMTDEDGLEENPYSVANRIYVHLPMINGIADKTGFDDMNSFEKACYLFVNNVDDAILKTEDRLVRALMEKYEEMRNNEEWWSWADAIERGEVAAEMRMREKTENARREGISVGLSKGLEKGLNKGLKEGLNKGLKEGLSKGLKEGLSKGLREGELQGEIKGKKTGRIEERIETLRLLIKTKYQVNDENWLFSLSSSQLKKAIASILNCDTFDQLKQKIDTKA